MRGYVVRRLLQMGPTVLAIVIFNFLLIRLAPGDPARTMAGENASPQNVEAIRLAFGLDRPVLDQLVIYLSRLAQGDLGFSFRYSVPVAELIADRLPQTLYLMLTASLVSIVLGTLLGALAARFHPSAVDSALNLTALAFYSMPIFWFGILAIFVFGITLRWFPTGGMMDVIDRKQGLDLFADLGWHAVLPILTLSAYNLPVFLRIARASVIETMREDYMTTLRAVGMGETRIFIRHALRNALLPTVTLAGLTLGFVLTGAILTETVFGWPGIGRLMTEAIFSRDYPTMMGVFLVSSVFVVFAGFLTDVTYVALDPRVRLT